MDANVTNTAGALAQSESGFLDKLKDLLDPSTLMEKLNRNKDTLLAMVLYCGIGFLVGYILKKHFKIIFIFSLPIIALFVLAQFDMLSVIFNWTKLGGTFGIKPLPALDANLLHLVWAWVKSNIALTLSGCVGFFIGLRLG